METCDFSSQRGCNAFSHCPANVTHFFLDSTNPITIFYIFLSWAEWWKEWLQSSPSCVSLSWGWTCPGHLSHPSHENPPVTHSGLMEKLICIPLHPLSCLCSSSWTFSTLIVRGFMDSASLEWGGQQNHQLGGRDGGRCCCTLSQRSGN